MEVDEELSAAMLVYFRGHRLPYPPVNPEGVRAVATTRTAEALIAEINALSSEIWDVPVAWSTMTHSEGVRLATAEMATRHPELTHDAISALGNYFGSASR